MSIIRQTGERAQLEAADHPFRTVARLYTDSDATRQRIAAIRLLREAFGWTYQEIARFTRLSVGHVCRLDQREKSECPAFFESAQCPPAVPPETATAAADA